MFRLFSFILSFVFLVQSTAWATGAETLEQKAVLHEFVVFYNSLSAPAKKAELKKMLKLRTAEDQKFISKSLGDLSKINLPQLKLVDDALTFTWDKKNITMKPVQGTVMEINGKKIDFAPGKYEMAVDELQAMFSQKSFSLMDLFITPAYAGVDTVVVGAAVTVAGIIAIIAGIYLATIVGLTLVIGGIISFFGGIATMTSNASGDKKVASLCDTAREKWNELSGGTTAEQLLEIKKALVDAKSKLIGDPACIGGDDERMAICNNVTACLDNLTNEINKMQGAENSSRGQVKDIQGPTPSKTQQNGSSNQ